MNPQKLLVFGGHPDDPESSCGGLIANAVAAGHTAHCLYGTNHRVGYTYFGRPEKEVRSAEAVAACKILGATWEFLDYPEHLEVNPETRRRVADVIAAYAPDIVVAHWPVDTHPDHRSVGILAFEAYLLHRSYAFYFFEVMTGRQSIRFTPSHYVDISAVAETKRAAVMCHLSQTPDEIWADHEIMHRFRGRECDVERAEAYLRVDREPGGLLPGMVF